MQAQPRRDWLTGDNRNDVAGRAIRAAALQVLVEHGIDGFTVERVARQAGCSRATLYRLTGGKKALIDDLLSASAAEVNRRIRARVRDLHGPERIARTIEVSLEEVRSVPAVAQWVRRVALSDLHLGRGDAFPSMAAELTGLGGADAQLTGEWVHRVVLSFLVWPAADAQTERALIRVFTDQAATPS